MSILFDRGSRVIVQGMTGSEGSYHTSRMIDSGTQVVGGVTPGKGGQRFTPRLGDRALGEVPIFDTVAEARARTGANVSCIFVPPAGAADAIMEAGAAGIELVVAITENIPVLDMARVAAFFKESPTRLIGPNCPGLATPGAGKVGIMPYHIFKEGRVGFLSRSGTLTYEVVALLSEAGIGQSTCIGVGGDPIIGTPFVDALRLFEADPGTDAVVICGEIGGSDEEDAAAYARTMRKPVIGFISGRTAPPGKRMGHAGAIVSGSTGTAQGKVEALQTAGVPVAETIFDIPALTREALGKVGAG
jgi:succinyl-CoA synthetase alpha subunit